MLVFRAASLIAVLATGAVAFNFLPPSGVKIVDACAASSAASTAISSSSESTVPLRARSCLAERQDTEDDSSVDQEEVDSATVVVADATDAASEVTQTVYYTTTGDAPGRQTAAVTATGAGGTTKAASAGTAKATSGAQTKANTSALAPSATTTSNTIPPTITGHIMSTMAVSSSSAVQINIAAESTASNVTQATVASDVSSPSATHSGASNLKVGSIASGGLSVVAAAVLLAAWM